MAEALLQTAGLRAGYGGKPVLQGLDLAVGHGEIVAVIGRNGVGKSTLMRSLIGLIRPMQGSLSLDGRDITALSPHHRARAGLGYVPQGRDVFPRLSVEENLQIGERMRTRARPASSADYERIYGYFPILRERRRQAAATFSGGQQQQLAVARALIGGPSVLLLDEPSEGIQPSIVQDIARIMVELNQETGLTILLVEQNLDMIRAMAQRALVLDKGRITASLQRADLQDRDAMRRHLAL